MSKSAQATHTTFIAPPTPGAVLLDDQDPSISSIPGINGIAAVASRTITSPVGSPSRGDRDDSKRSVSQYEKEHGAAPTLPRGKVHPLPKVEKRNSQRRHTEKFQKGKSLKQLVIDTSPSRETSSANATSDKKHRLSLRTPKGRVNFNIPGQIVEDVQEVLSPDVSPSARAQKLNNFVRRVSRSNLSNREISRISRAATEQFDKLKSAASVDKFVDMVVERLVNRFSEWLTKADGTSNALIKALEDKNLYPLSALARLIFGLLKMVGRALAVGASAALFGVALSIAVLTIPFIILFGIAGLASDKASNLAVGLLDILYASLVIAGKTFAYSFVGAVKLALIDPFKRLAEVLSIAIYSGIAIPAGLALLTAAAGFFALSYIPFGILRPFKCTACLPVGIEKISKNIYSIACQTFNFPRAAYVECSKKVRTMVGKSAFSSAIDYAQNREYLSDRIIRSFDTGPGKKLAALI